MALLKKRVLICAPADEVWRVLSDFGAAEQWAPAVVESRISGETDRGAGARRILTTTRGDVTEEVVVEWNEGKGFTFEIPAGLANIVTDFRESWSVEPARAESEVAVAMEYGTKGGWINALVDLFVVRRILGEMLVQNLAGLKYHVETGRRVTPRTKGLPVAAVV